ncbi:MAG: CooT family nickel-binding protein [Desulfarculus sp.]|nr:CooT family nickel-binding protein [Desulfarculus sp.]
MCEATVYVAKADGGQEVLLEDVDLVEFEDGDQVRLVSIFGDQLSLRARVRSMSLAAHRILLERV